jgi:hypothetical protein
MGATAEFASVASLLGGRTTTRGALEAPQGSCLIVAADTLATIQARPAELASLRDRIHEFAHHIVVYGFDETAAHAAVLSAWSAEALSGIQPLDEAATFSVCDGYRQFCGALSGVSLGDISPLRDYGFASGAGRRPLHTMIRVGETPFLTRVETSGRHVYFVGTRDLADLDEPIARGADIRRWFSRLAPLMMILRGVLGNRVWRALSPHACFIIDDPLLRPRYGFLEYRRLIEAMRPHRFFPCIAFIPWNHGRSDRDVAALLASRFGEPFLCVHGCNHTRAEFAITDSRALESLASIALRRMTQQLRVSGVGFDEVMVFPQGLFSAEAIAALSSCGYLAAVNTDVFPSTPSSISLTLRDLIDVAVSRFADCPLFARRYPRDLSALAFDLFLGKPALVVEHHGYFRNGYGELVSFVEALNRLEPELQWSNVGHVCERAALTRTTDNGDRHIRFFTARFRLSNEGSRSHTYVLKRPWSSAGEPPSVSVNDRAWPSETAAGQLTIRLTVAPGQTAAIRVNPPGVVRRSTAAALAGGGGARVRVRRYMSEFRDNHVDTSPMLRAVVAAARTVRRGRAVADSAPRSVNP